MAYISSPERYRRGMSTQVAVQLSDEAMAFVDEQVALGAAATRADYIASAVEREQRRVAAERDLEVLRQNPYDEFDQMHEWVRNRGYPEAD